MTNEVNPSDLSERVSALEKAVRELAKIVLLGGGNLEVYQSWHDPESVKPAQSPPGSAQVPPAPGQVVSPTPPPSPPTTGGSSTAPATDSTQTSAGASVTGTSSNSSTTTPTPAGQSAPAV